MLSFIAVWSRISVYRTECLSNTQILTAILTHKRGDFSPCYSRELTFALELLCSSFFDKCMKDEAARQFGVVITKEECYSGKLEKQVRRISIAFALWFASPHNSFRLMRRRRLECGWWPTGSLWLFAFTSGDVRARPFQNLPLLFSSLTNSHSLLSLRTHWTLAEMDWDLLFCFSHFVAVKFNTECLILDSEDRRQSVILQHNEHCALHQCTVFIVVRGWSYGHPSKIYFPQKTNFAPLANSFPHTQFSE